MKYRRFSRISFILTRCSIISFAIILLLQIYEFLKPRHREQFTFRDKYNSLAINEDSFWKQIENEDKYLSDVQRIKQIEFVDKQFKNDNINWTNIFLSSYRRKLNKIKERDDNNIHKYRFNETSQIVTQSTYEIFEETLVFQRPKFCSSNRIFHSQCPYSNCKWSCEKPSINQKNIRRASIFHHTDIIQNAMIDKLQRRSSNDIWILWIDEANRQIQHLNQYKFNWTLSFRQDSEVSIGSYGILIDKTQSTDISFDRNSDFEDILNNRNIPINNIEYRIFFNFRYRHKYALWFVSNCIPQRRLTYYQQLKQLYPIEAFGGCVQNKCRAKKSCEYDHYRLGMFYLSFESQTCTDYITEKFWRALSHGLIPIVLGPSKQSYLDLGVPQSAFIHVDDFQTIDQLSQHLHKISNDYFLYRNYFQWLYQYDVFFNINDLEPIRMCELCMRLNIQDFSLHSFYKDVHQWHGIGC